MKKYILFLSIFALVFAGCSDDENLGNDPGKEEPEKEQPGMMIWDFVNYNVMFKVVDEVGNDMLDEETEGYISLSNITVYYNKEEYKYALKSKANLPLPLAVRIENNEELNATLFCFGEFDPTETYKDETFVVDWGDGTKDTIRFNLYITWEDEYPTVHKAVYLNDEIYSDTNFLIEIVKK